MFIVGTVQGVPTPADGSYLVDYDPTRPGTGGWACHLEYTHDPAKAKVFAHQGEALELWKKVSGKTRPDGKPDRPLTAYTVEILKVGDIPSFWPEV